MSLHTWLVFAAITLATSYTPGPNMLLSMSHGMQHGVHRAPATAIGLVAGLWVLMIISTAGFGAILAASENAFLVVKWCGVAYLAYLGLRTWRSPAPSFVATDGAPHIPVWRQTVQAFGVSLSNPKAIVYISALFPQFIDTRAPILSQFFILAITFSVIEFTMSVTTANGAGRLVPWLNRRGSGLINRISGGVLMGAAALLATVRRI